MNTSAKLVAGFQSPLGRPRPPTPQRVGRPSGILPSVTIPALVQTVMPDFVATLASRSAAASIFEQGLQLAFDGAGAISVPTILGNSAYASFVAEGAPIPVQQGHVEPLVTLTPKKLAAIVVLTTEMVRSSNIEALMLDALIRSVGLELDKALLDDQP